MLLRVVHGGGQAEPEASQWQAFREASLIRFYKIMHDGVHSIRPRIEFRFNDAYFGPKRYGMDLPGLAKVWDSIRNSDYSGQKAGDPAELNHRREWFTSEREAVGPKYPIIAGVAVRPKMTPELIHQAIDIGLDINAIGLSLGHYDGAEFPMLRAVREELAAKKVIVPKTLAKKQA
jgi:hypothetical protein